MNKFAKVLSVVLSATIALSVCVVMLVSSLAAATPTFSLNVVKEEKDYVIVSVKLDSGAFTSVNFEVNGSGNVGKCEYILTTDEYDAAEKQVKVAGGQAINAPYANGSTGKFGAALTIAFDKTGKEIVTCKFAKNTAEKVTNKDLTLAVTSCNDGEDKVVTAKAVNNIPAPVAPTTKSTTEPTTKPTTEPTTKKTEPSTEKTEPSTEKTEPSTEKTEPSTEKTEPSTEKTEPSTEKTEPSTEKTEPSTEKTEPSTEATEPSTEATEPSTEKTEPSTEATEPSTEATEPSTEATEPSTEATEPSTEATEATENDDVDVTEAPATDATEATTAVDGDVVNPNTGDSATATVAIASLLALSAAAVVALRKKED